ncbi:Stk1 family PASTA domain-containing Ser/Thr kinase [Streptomyces verrucosisporus]|uniref:Stk1 family PASTA domain-containing Ser/Thr kinase n=1 Tax=Streptomyces verrucosisporus TaxID=1695161 RepID=UPI0019D1D5FA|nr:Stk1 family PASTA domain-containing Ser/Thr kinase [Streptomyces verrucosisporus]MBN3928341.1 Stk1 family PASTA domain-containing Ser/Thr kinase [Streptomyces verrucosisporus]
MDTTLRDPLIGHVLDGRYRVESRIAVGGMATVYRAMDTRLDRELALKVMHPSLAADASFVDRFIREAKSAARLSHQNVVGVFDQGEDGGYVYLAMEYVRGCTLREVLRERGALRPRAALDVLEPVLAALGAAHLAGLVHRDVKPENVLIGDDGRVKVADFGLVRAVGSQTSASTGSVLGTVSYLAPEQIEHGTADARADVYACGVVLYEMLTGSKPHAGGTPAQVLYQHLHQDVPAPSALVPGLAPALDDLVARTAARDPGRRPADAVELLAEVGAVKESLTGEELDALPPAAAGGDGSPAPAGSEDRTTVLPRGGAPKAPVGGPEEPGEALNRTSVLPRPDSARTPSREPGPPGPGGRRRWAGRGPGRSLPALVTAVLLVLGTALGLWYINSGQFTRTPGVLDMTEDRAKRTVEEAGLEWRIVRDYSDTVERGHVIGTDPGRGERIRGNGTVTITVSQGPERVEVPDVTGDTPDEARRKIKAAGLKPGMVTREFSGKVERGSVARTEPGSGSVRRPGTAVALVLSKGTRVEVPGVVGEDEGTARQRLEEAGLEVRTAPERVFSEEDEGTVARQSPREGAVAGEGDSVTLTVSKGPEMIEVPDVEGLEESEARQALEEAGFEVRVRRVFFTGTVFDQSVAAGERAPRGSEITVWVR